MKPFIVAIDVGAPRNIGWYCSTFEKEPGDHSCGTIDDLPVLLEKKDYLAIGFEAPLFIPVTDFKNFTKKREFDGNRPWSAGAGAYVTTVNLPLLVLCIKTIAKAHDGIEFTSSYHYWKEKRRECILFWEAFISGESQIEAQNPHIQAAQSACELFRKNSYQPLALPKEQWINLPAMLTLGMQLNIKFIDPEVGLVVKSEATNDQG